ncbi:unnamed protein product [Symbiodinium natans]|uniref:Uncharacterized protein n=1 Tax=Symbiodinium natans TaxID=878477 RepID=A0A812KT44_9DINO|nr:unnamed protein product [Symbiodinium natans]
MQNVAWQRGVILALRGVAGPPGVTGRGVKTWRHCLMWRHGDTWCRRTWRQNVASQTHVASLMSHLAAPDRVSERGYVASEAYVASGPHVSSSQASRTDVASLDVASVRGMERSLKEGSKGMMTHDADCSVGRRYRVPIKQEIDENDTGHYEGRIIDKRIGGQDRESFIELKDVLKVDIDGNIIGKEKNKRLIDAFIEDCKVIDKRDESWDSIKLQSEVEAAKLQPPVINQASNEDDGEAMPMMGMMPGMMMMQNMMQGGAESRHDHCAGFEVNAEWAVVAVWARLDAALDPVRAIHAPVAPRLLVRVVPARARARAAPVPALPVPALAELAPARALVPPVPARAPARAPARVPAHAPAHAPARVPERVSARVPARVPLRAPARAPAHVPERVRVHVRAHVLERVPARLRAPAALAARAALAVLAALAALDALAALAALAVVVGVAAQVAVVEGVVVAVAAAAVAATLPAVVVGGARGVVVAAAALVAVVVVARWQVQCVEGKAWAAATWRLAAWAA